MSLRTNYKDDILDTDINVNRKFNIISSGGTVIQSDVEIRETTAFTQQGDSFGAADINATNEAINALFDIFHPIGYTFAMDNADFNPNTAPGWHGTWERIKDCVIYAAGDNDTVGAIVGSNDHTLTVDELPPHDHPIPALSGTTNETGEHHHRIWSGNAAMVPSGSTYGINASNNMNSWSGLNGSHSHTVTTNASTTGTKGSGTAMDLRSRRLNCYIWKRVS